MHPTVPKDDDVMVRPLHLDRHRRAATLWTRACPIWTKAARPVSSDEMNRVLAAFALNVDIDAVGLSDYGPPVTTNERQVARLDQTVTALRDPRSARR